MYRSTPSRGDKTHTKLCSEQSNTGTALGNPRNFEMQGFPGRFECARWVLPENQITRLIPTVIPGSAGYGRFALSSGGELGDGRGMITAGWWSVSMETTASGTIPGTVPLGWLCCGDRECVANGGNARSPGRIRVVGECQVNIPHPRHRRTPKGGSPTVPPPTRATV